MSELRDITDRAPNLGLVSMLEELLDRAKSGDLRSAVVVTVRADNAVGHQWSIDPRTWWQPVIGELAYTQSELAMSLSLRQDAGVLRNL